MVNILFAAAVVVCAAALARPLFLLSGGKRADYIARQDALAIYTALVAYSERHEGSFPDDGRITGGGDALTREKILLRYPDNPFAQRGTAMKKVPFGSPSPGDFSYRRSAEKKYEFEFIVYGARGAVFEHKMEQ